MARMIPEHGPHDTESYGERDLYWKLKKDLPEDYTVIHSLPWLCSAVKKLDPKAKPTGEIDFLIIHPEHGVLALEVKSGVYRVENSLFVHVRNNYTINPISQTRRNVHGLSSWLGGTPSLFLKIGYGFIFPNSDFRAVPTSPGLYDTTASPPQALYIDYLGMPDVAEHIIALMIYWKGALSNSNLGAAKVTKLINFLTPTIDGQPQWGSRVLYDNKVWLQLTDEQIKIVRSVLRNENSLITGWPGTGKTLIVVETARKMSIDSKRVLVISFNNRLTEYIRSQLSEYELCTVLTWHGLCRQAAKTLGRAHGLDDWYKVSCVDDLREAINQDLLSEYDALIVDESQALSASWCEALALWFKGKQKAYFCDETQVFPFERGTISLTDLRELLGVDPFPLTIILRMPKAVTEILSEVVPPKIQHYSPRNLEHDTALEVITITPCEDLVKIKQNLIDDGVRSEDIIILTGSIISRLYNDFLLSRKIPSETIAKFRGLEAPIVLILGAEQLGTAELFSAYSRATSKCIAFYNAHNLYWVGKEGFQARLQSRPESNAALIKEQQGLRIKNLVNASTCSTPLNLQSLNISWAVDWSAWLIEIDNNETPILLWIDLLCKNLSHPIFFWYKDTLNRFYRASLVKVNEQENISHHPVSLHSCDKCGRLTPHTFSRAYHCSLCEAKLTPIEAPNASFLEEINLIDKVITLQLPKDFILEFQPRLPIALAAAAAFLHAKRRKLRTNALDVPLPDGRSLYLAAFTFAQSRIATHDSTKAMSVNVLADEIYGRYALLQKIDSFEWRKIFANAMSQFYSKGYVTKAGKGIYHPVEDDLAPVPWHLAQKAQVDADDEYNLHSLAGTEIL